MVEKTVTRSDKPIPWAEPDLSGNAQRYVAEAVASSWISGGPFIERFEQQFAQYCGARHAITSSNGTTALHMAFLALGVGPGDEVIVPGFAFMAAANVALHVGAKPVFTEVDPMTWCMTASGVEQTISPRTKVIVPVHTYGNVCAMDEIVAVGQSRSVTVIEDAAEALGSHYKESMAGTRAVLGTFSFHASKTITTGEGGMVVVRDPQLYAKLQLLRNHGVLHKRYWHEVAGHNFRMTNMQAALGCAQLEKIDEITRQRQRVYSCYQQCLKNVRGVTMQYFEPEVHPLVWAIAVKLDPKAYKRGRDDVMQRLLQSNIETRNGFYASSMLSHLYSCPRLPVCEELSEWVISLPTFCGLQDSQIEFICAELEALRN